MRVRFAVGLSALLVFLPAGFAAEHTTDTLDAVKKAIADGKAVLLDVREKTEWDNGHLKEAAHLALSRLKDIAQAEDVAGLAPKGKVLYLHCASGIRCLKAADALKKLGYDVRPLKAGYRDLLEAGFAPAR